jgi:hypothetical protein
MNRTQIYYLESIISGQAFSASIIDMAIEKAIALNNFEAKVLLKALKSGLAMSFQARMNLQVFVCDLLADLKASKATKAV